MRAMSIARLGGPEVFEAVERDPPRVRAGHLVIRVAATSVNPVDTRVRAVTLPFSPALPAILHGDVAGTVEEVGPEIEGFAVGDAVYGCAGAFGGYDGALAESMLVDAALMAKKPERLSMAQAAALPLVAITAWEGLVDKARIGPDDHLLVHGATGGVGHVAIQLAKARGARVAATGSAAKMAAAEALGADALIDYRAQSAGEYVAALTGGAGFDVVLDTVGGPHLQTAFDTARRNGRVITLTRGEADYGQVTIKALSLHGVLMLLPLLTGEGRAAHGAILREIAALVDRGALTPLVDPTVFSIRDVAAAHAHFESGAAVGKVVLTA